MTVRVNEGKSEKLVHADKAIKAYSGMGHIDCYWG